MTDSLQDARKKAWLKVAVGTGLVAFLLSSFRFGLSDGNSATVAAMGMLLLPWVLAPRDVPPKFRCSWQKDIVPLLKWAVILGPIFLIGFHLWHNLVLGKELSPEFSSQRMANLNLEFILIQVIAIALPEEYFFRGFIQPTLQPHLGKIRIPLFKLHISWAIIVASALFAIVHLVVIPAPFRLAVFFPGIIFGFMYERSGSLTQPILFHAGSNVFLALCNGIWGLSG